MKSRTVAQWEKDDLDTLGVITVDILASRKLKAIHRAFHYTDEKLDSPIRT